MNKEFCFGIIPLKRTEDDWKVFLVKHNKGHWGFPKGHSLLDESPEQIACREVFEETGLSVTKFLQVSPLTEKYIFQDENKTIDKSVTYFLAEVKGDVKLLNKEVCDSKWVCFDEALELLTFEQAKEVCIEAMKILNLPEVH
jgi:bis(5'-nucleosidyl)-tetraphosphatase